MNSNKNNQKAEKPTSLYNLSHSELHWWNFPLADFSIKLEHDFKKKFFEFVYKERVKSLDFASYMNGKSKKHSKKWTFKTQRALLWEYKVHAEFVPAWFVYEAALYLEQDLHKIEKKIISYMTFRGRTVIIKPILPLKTTPEFTSLLIHMMCDGTIRKDTFFYFQKDDWGLNRFIKIVRNVFGDYNNYHKRGHLVPLIFKKIISSYFETNEFGSFTSNIPEKLFTLNKYHRIAAIAAALFDDGMSSSGVRFFSASLRFIQGLKKLAESLNYKCTNILKNKKPSNNFLYTFNISAESIEKFYEDLKMLFNQFPLMKIGKKYEYLRRFVEIKNRGWNQRKKFETKKIILKSLEESPKTAVEIRDVVNVSKWTVYHHLQKLIRQERVKKEKIVKCECIYSLT